MLDKRFAGRRLLHEGSALTGGRIGPSECDGLGAGVWSHFFPPVQGRGVCAWFLRRAYGKITKPSGHMTVSVRTPALSVSDVSLRTIRPSRDTDLRVSITERLFGFCL
jgi:hypothetical protein